MAYLTADRVRRGPPLRARIAQSVEQIVNTTLSEQVRDHAKPTGLPSVLGGRGTTLRARLASDFARAHSS